MKKIRIKKYLKYLTKSSTYLYLYFTILACKDGNWKIVQDDTFVCLGWWNDNENNIDLIAGDYKAGIFYISGIGIVEYKSDKKDLYSLSQQRQKNQIVDFSKTLLDTERFTITFATWISLK